MRAFSWRKVDIKYLLQMILNKMSNIFISNFQGCKYYIIYDTINNIITLLFLM